MYDIRKNQFEEPKSLRFDDDNEDGGNCTVLTLTDLDDETLVVVVTDNNGSYLTLESKEAAEGLVRALEYALDNGWWEDNGE